MMQTLKKATTICACIFLGIGILACLVIWALLTRGRFLQKELRPLKWWEHTVLYQIYPRSFQDSDDDGVGDIQGITNRLEHFVDAGIEAVWISPIFVSPMIDMGYDISDFYDIDSTFGNMKDFELMLEKAHRLGIKVLLDYVPNHASTKSIYFKKSENREPGFEDFFIWADPLIDPKNASNRMIPSNWITLFGGTTWEWSEKRQQYYLHQFAKEQADFNFRHPGVRQEMINIMKYWFDKGVDGFRLDALPHLFEADPKNFGGRYPDEPPSGLSSIPFHREYSTREHTKSLSEVYEVVYEWREFTDEYERKNNRESLALLSEGYCNMSMTMLYYGDGEREGAHFPFNFDFITELAPDSDAHDFVHVMRRWLDNMPPGKVANWVFGNHDRPRLPSRFRPNMVDGLNGLNMILPGVAISFQGEEIGMKDGFVSWEDTVDIGAIYQGTPSTYLNYSRDPSRTPFHWDNSTNAGFSNGKKTWLPIAQDYLQLNLRTQKEAPRSHYKVYQALTTLRKEPALSHGDYYIQALSQYTVILIRYLMTYDSYAIIFNVGAARDTVDISKTSHLLEPLTVYVSSVHSQRNQGDTLPFGKLTLQPGEAIVFKSPSSSTTLNSLLSFL